VREFKFRVWDKHQKVMYVSPNEIEHLGSWLDAHLPGAAADKNRIILMQFTGLPDAQGQEIWQGDILDASYINPMTGENVVKLYTVIPGDDKCDACKAKHFKHRLYDTPLFLVNSRTKVIGNIYENPELLETEAGK